MLDLDIINAEIAKLEAGKTDYNAVERLSQLYTVRDHHPRSVSPVSTIQAGGEAVKTPVGGRSDFLLAVDGMDAARAWAVMDDLMSCLRRTNSKMYESTMKRLNAI